jgi:hypothetical protein
MGKTYKLPAVVAAAVLGTAALSGCTSAEPAPTQPPATSASAFDDSAIIFQVQKDQIGDKATPPGTVMKQYSGTGSATVHVPPLPAGQKSLGSTVICSGSGEWNVSIDQATSGWSRGTCSMDGGSVARYQLANPSKETAVRVDVPAGTNVWVTFFSTE